jgi:quercetin dioxygenase-like cupin family protein
MHVIRLYTGPDNQSHFEDVDLPFAPSGESDSTPRRAASGVSFNRYPPGFKLNWHPAPRRQYVVNLEGQAEIEVGDGTKKRFGPGDVLLAEDLTGQGHITRVVGNKARVTMWVALEGG